MNNDKPFASMRGNQVTFGGEADIDWADLSPDYEYALGHGSIAPVGCSGSPRHDNGRLGVGRERGCNAATRGPRWGVKPWRGLLASTAASGSYSLKSVALWLNLL
jgi:hypothetical protein